MVLFSSVLSSATLLFILLLSLFYLFYSNCFMQVTGLYIVDCDFYVSHPYDNISTTYSIIFFWLLQLAADHNSVVSIWQLFHCSLFICWHNLVIARTITYCPKFQVYTALIAVMFKSILVKFKVGMLIKFNISPLDFHKK